MEFIFFYIISHLWFFVIIYRWHYLVKFITNYDRRPIANLDVCMANDFPEFKGPQAQYIVPKSPSPGRNINYHDFINDLII